MAMSWPSGKMQKFERQPPMTNLGESNGSDTHEFEFDLFNLLAFSSPLSKLSVVMLSNLSLSLCKLSTANNQITVMLPRCCVPLYSFGGRTYQTINGTRLTAQSPYCEEVVVVDVSRVGYGVILLGNIKNANTQTTFVTMMSKYSKKKIIKKKP